MISSHISYKFDKCVCLLDAPSFNHVLALQDPNTNVAMFETPQIIEYLERTYAV